MARTTSKLPQKATVSAARVKTSRQVAAPRHIQEFFGKYPTFDYHVNAPFLHEFKRLCKHMKWERPKNMSDEAWEKRQKEVEEPKKRARNALRTAMVEEFNQMYGRDANDLAAWKHLCNALGVETPKKVGDCKQLLASTHVNLVDFLQAEDPTKPVRIFSSEVELAAYTRRHEKFFPREHVAAGSLLRCLLRRILRYRVPSAK